MKLIGLGSQRATSRVPVKVLLRAYGRHPMRWEAGDKHANMRWDHAATVGNILGNHAKEKEEPSTLLRIGIELFGCS